MCDTVQPRNPTNIMIPRSSLVSNVGKFVGSGFDCTDICCRYPASGMMHVSGCRPEWRASYLYVRPRHRLLDEGLSRGIEIQNAVKMR